MSLYRKYRPQKFKDLIGQDHVVQTLTNALGAQNFSHAYLFSGPKGSGKTTVARLMGKALNCVDEKNIEPCDKCVSCREIVAGSSLDVIEIDAASNRGIDEIRELRDKVKFAPTSGKYKIYIIDECHMLTREAFNALLKTLEEPPAHAVFILATTEIHKVPATIISRSQSFEFRKATLPEVKKLLNKIIKAENIKIDEASINLVAQLSGGAYRDALTLLDQVATLGTDKRHTINISETQLVLGQANQEIVWQFVISLLKSDRSEALKIVEKIYSDGKDLEHFIADVILLLRKMILVKEGINMDFEATKEESEKLTALTATSDVAELVQIIEKLTEVIGKVKTSVLGQLPLEMAVFEITKNDVIASQQTPLGTQQSNTIEAKTLAPKIISQHNNSDKFDAIKWPEVVKIVKAHNNAIAAMIKNTVFKETQDHNIILAVKFKFHAEQICNKKNLKIIEEAVEKVVGETYRVDCIVDPELNIKKPLEAEEELLDSAKEIFETE